MSSLCVYILGTNNQQGAEGKPIDAVGPKGKAIFTKSIRLSVANQILC